ncbi:hypothetical protein RCL1_000890 [Eukaryota sp. TZLM3-RCL]
MSTTQVQKLFPTQVNLVISLGPLALFGIWFGIVKLIFYTADHALLLLIGLGVICHPFAVGLTLSQRSYLVENGRRCKSSDVIFFLLSFIPIFFLSYFCFYHGSNVASYIRLFVSFSVSAFMCSLMLPFFMITNRVLSGGCMYAIAVGFAAFLVTLAPPPIPVPPHPLITLLDTHVLEDFPVFVSVPQTMVEIDLLPKIAKLATRRLQVIAGQPGCGKSVSLFSFLKDKHVLWVSGRALPCENLRFLGLNVSLYSQEDCLELMQNALRTKNYTLVIDDAQTLEPSSLLTRLFKSYGAVESTPFPIYFTVSDYNAFMVKLHPLIHRVYSPHWYSYPSDDVINNLTDSLNLNFTKTMMDVGPSLRLIQLYATDADEVRVGCNSLVSMFSSLPKDALELMLNATRLISHDHATIDLLSLGNYPLLSELYHLNFLTAGPNTVTFHNPLVRRAACSFFSKSMAHWDLVKDSCDSVSFCNNIRHVFILEY